MIRERVERHPKDISRAPSGNVRTGLRSIFAFVGVFGGIAFIFVGLVLGALFEVGLIGEIYHTVSGRLLVAAIPMIVVGSLMVEDKSRGNNAVG